MTETVLDSVTIASGGGTATGVFALDEEADVAAFHLTGDADSTSLDVAVSGVAFEDGGSFMSPTFTSSVTAIDATTNDRAFTLGQLEGFESVEITVTNGAASTDPDATVSLVQEDVNAR